jgi:uncharacterized protein YndB with AHSA1/START domain
VVTIRARTLIRAPAARVWRVLTDWEGQASWMPDVAWIRALGTNRELGAELEVRTKVFGLPLATDRVSVTAWEPPVRLGVDHVGVVAGTGEWLLEPAPDGSRTRFTWTESLRLPWPVIGGMALRVYAPVQRWMLKRSLRNLRRLVEDAESSNP